MTNSYYNYTSGTPVVNSRGSSAAFRNEFTSIGAGFDAVAAAGFVTSAVANATYAAINGPTFTGVAAGPTAPPGTATTQFATTAFVDASFLKSVIAAATYAPLVSPALTGTPTAPTAITGDNSTKIATTAFVQQTAFASTLPDQTGNSGKLLTTNGSTASWAAPASTGGTVTSVAISVPSFLSVAGSPVTTTGTLAVDLSGSALPVANGGTGFTGYSTGDIIYASGAAVLSKLADVATGNVLISGGISVAPSWGKVSLGGAQHVSGTLPVGNGGTGAVTLTGMLKGNGTSAFTVASPGSDFVAPGTATTFTQPQRFPASGVLVAGSSTGLTTLASANSSASNYTFTIPASTGTALTTAAAVTVAQGGTGATTLTGILKGNGTSAFTVASSGTDYYAPGNALGTPSSGTLSGCTVDGTNPVGYRNIPQITKVGNGEPTTGADLTYAGKHIYHTSTPGTFTIPDNYSIAFPIGTALTFFNAAGAGILTIAIGGTDAMILAGVGTTGSRTLAANGVATATKLTTTSWLISGTNLT